MVMIKSYCKKIMANSYGKYLPENSKNDSFFSCKKIRKRLNQKVVCANEGVLQVYSILQLSLLTNAHAVHPYF